MSETGQTVHDEVGPAVPSYAPGVKFTFLEDYSMPDLLATLASLPAEQHGLLFLLLARQHRHGSSNTTKARRPSPRQQSAHLRRVGFQSGLRYGGRQTDQRLLPGRRPPARSRCACCAAKTPDAIPVVRFTADRPNRYMFDYGSCSDSAFRSDALPKESVIENMPASFFGRHPVGSLVGIGLFLFLIVANSILVLNIRRRKAAERALVEPAGTSGGTGHQPVGTTGKPQQPAAPGYSQARGHRAGPCGNPSAC